jgi:hypothetical protein
MFNTRAIFTQNLDPSEVQKKSGHRALTQQSMTACHEFPSF